MSAFGKNYEKPEVKRNMKMRYPNMTVPDVTAVPVKGKRYVDMVPDTYDVEERANLALHSILAMTEPECDYDVYWNLLFDCLPPRLVYAYDSDACYGKYLETIALLRKVTGSDYMMEADQRWKEMMIQCQGPDGIFYRPMVGRPFDDSILDNSDNGMKTLKHPEKGMFCSFHTVGKIGSAMLLTQMEDNDPQWTERAKRLVDGMASKFRKYGDAVCMEAPYFSPEFEVDGDAVDFKASTSASWTTTAAGISYDDEEGFVPSGGLVGNHGWHVQALMQIYRLTGYEPALELAGKIVRLIMKSGIFAEDGRFEGFRHFHLHTLCLQGMIDYAMQTGDKEVEAVVKKAYEYGKTDGNDLVGYFAEAQHDPDGIYNSPGSVVNGYEPLETCEVADMIAIALKLAAMGHDECWDDADRWIRNVFSEVQLTDTSWIREFIEAGDFRKTPPAPHENADNVLERVVGTFASLAGPSSFVDESGRGAAVAGCCQTNGSRACFYIWSNIIKMAEDMVSVNLLLNRASAWADVHSYLPYEGRCDVVMKEDHLLKVRIPGWVNLKDVVCKVDEEAAEVTFDGRYAVFGMVKAGSTASVEFPISVKRVKTFIGGKPYTIWIKGADVIDINPRGHWGGYYKREHYRQNQVRWVKRERFVCDNPPPQDY